MTDKIEDRLRTFSDGESEYIMGGVLEEAADTIQAMREALERIANYSPGITHGWAEDVRMIAKRGLGDA